mgnify:CR=1 FL=1
MKITVFTSNQPRHLAYVRQLSEVADEVFFISESTTVFPGQIEDFYAKSATMQEYFGAVRAAELEVFGDFTFSPANARVLAIKQGDLNMVDRQILAPALDSDLYLVFGSSFIKGWLISELVEKRAVNIHMGLSPYYRGSSCNFWALYDEKPAFVGATVHLLSPGLDNGPALFHVRPDYQGQDLFRFTMESVRKVQSRIVEEISSGGLLDYHPRAVDASSQIRYTRNRDFTDAVASEFLARDYSPRTLQRLLDAEHQPTLL